MALPTAHWAYDPKLANVWPYDPDKAKKLLAEAGHPNGIDLTFLGYSDQRSQQRQEVLIEQLSKAGIRLKWQTGSIPEMSAAFFADKKGEALLAAWTGRPDPSLTYSLMFSESSYYNAGRKEWSPELTAALLETRASEDIEARKAAFAKVQKIVVRCRRCSCRWCSSSSSMPWSARSRATRPICWASRASMACGWSYRRAYPC